MGMILHPPVFHKDGDLVVVELLAFPVDQSRILLGGVMAESKFVVLQL